MKTVFGESSLLSNAHPEYEFREGQLQMAEAVAQAISSGQHLMVEAGTGIGKTLAYLIPAIESKKKFVVSTGTKNLQEQIFLKDIPFIRKKLGYSFKVCSMKGRENYLCLRRFVEFEKQPLFKVFDEISFFDAVRKWAEKTKTGDRGEMKGVPEDLVFWSDINARSDTCTGKKCSYFKECFLTRLKNDALSSSIVIVNHHLFFADLSIRNDFGAVIPPYEYIVFDEAHMVEEVATNFFGISVSRWKFEEILRDAEKLLPAGMKAQYRKKIFFPVKGSLDTFFSGFGAEEGRFRFTAKKKSEFVSRFESISNNFDLFGMSLAQEAGASDELENILRRGEELILGLRFLLLQEDRRYVYWYEVRRKNVTVQASPIDVSEILRQNLFEQVKCAILTSATLSIAGDFSFFRERLGIADHRELIVESPFNYQEQAIMYLSGSTPDPHDGSFPEFMERDLLKLLDISKGRAFVLFTSVSNMRKLHGMIEIASKYPLLLQGEMPKAELIEKFRSGKGMVLFATSSFWHGVDVQGEALSLVAIDKIPFDVPSDPLISARIGYLRELGRDAFNDYQLPMAVIELKQGLGRLIRSKKDRGILALFDSRVLRRRYGKVFLDSLPPFKVTDDLEEVRSFFKRS
jgi:ATP-dependent DNA helicase DinG